MKKQISEERKTHVLDVNESVLHYRIDQMLEVNNSAGCNPIQPSKILELHTQVLFYRRLKIAKQKPLRIGEESRVGNCLLCGKEKMLVVQLRIGHPRMTYAHRCEVPPPDYHVYWEQISLTIICSHTLETDCILYVKF